MAQSGFAPVAPPLGGTVREPRDARVPERLRAAVLGFLAVLTGASVAGAALSPYLLVKSPLLLVAVSAAAHHVALAAASVEPLPLIVVATLRRTLTGLSAFGLGYIYGPATLGWLSARHPRLAGVVSWLSRGLTRFGAPLLVLLPAPTVALLAGAARRQLSLVVPCLLVGQALYSTLVILLGEALARRTHLLTAFFRQHLLVSTLVCASLIALTQVPRLMKRLRARAEPPREA